MAKQREDGHLLSKTINTNIYKGSADIISDLSTLFCGFNPKRVFNGYAFVGVGLNHALIMMKLMLLIREVIKWNICERQQKLRIGRLGLGCNLRLNDCLAIIIEGNANIFIR